MKIKIKKYLGNPERKIQAIKDFRNISGYGLKEAKNVVDEVLDNSEPTVELTPMAVSKLKKEPLFEFSFYSHDELRPKMEELVVRLMEQEYFDVAKQMIDVLETFIDQVN